mgnify:CR=1 FL=1
MKNDLMWSDVIKYFKKKTKNDNIIKDLEATEVKPKKMKFKLFNKDKSKTS